MVEDCLVLCVCDWCAESVALAQEKAVRAVRAVRAVVVVVVEQRRIVWLQVPPIALASVPNTFVFCVPSLPLLALHHQQMQQKR